MSDNKPAENQAKADTARQADEKAAGKTPSVAPEAKKPKMVRCN